MFDYLRSFFLSYPYRCRRCTHRFFSSKERVEKMRYANCPRCGNFDLMRISSKHVPVRWFPNLQRAIRHRSYRCDLCRWRFFDRRHLHPKHRHPASEESKAESQVAS